MSSLSVVHPGAKLGKNVSIGPFCYIEENVTIGDDTVLEAHVTVFGGSVIGKRCHIYPGAVIGAPGQDLGYKGEDTTVEIGDDVTIREHCTLHRGTTARWKTTVGDGCYLMAYAHIAHDCIIGKKCILANAVNLGGHVEVGDFTNIGGMVAVHQFCQIGRHTMVGGGSIVRKDIPHYVKVARDPVSYIGVNTIGLKRKGFPQKDVDAIIDIYRLLFVKHRNLNKALEAIRNDIPESPVKNEILDFVANARRGLIKGL